MARIAKSNEAGGGASVAEVLTGSGAQGCPEDLPPGLRYVDDSRRGYTREWIDGKFAFFNTQGKRIDDEAEIRRINALAIPPAYIDVWICPDAHGHLQATGRDARGRKQYRYHPQWRETRDATKYERMLAFSAVLPKLRARVTRDLALDGMPRDKVLATVVRLLDTTLVRVGSEEYARENQSYGLTTLLKRHLKVSSGTLRFRFRGKSGIEHDVSVSDARVAKIVKRCMDLPGQDLFQYLDADGERHAVSSSDINDYLREITGADFTAKDYRTWAGSVFALAALRRLQWETVTEARKHIVGTIKEVSQLLRNTPAVCRKCYVHPAVIEAFEAGELAESMPASRRHGLKTDEAALAIFLEKDAKRRAREAARKNRKGTVPNDARLTNLLAESSKKARAGGLKASGKSAAAQAVSTVARKTRPKAARPAAKKLARTRSPAAVAMS
ncbi:DNA topoisomerase IB [Caballeronia sp. LP006]|uniref:DNA topoisomerase IB n=1 Tax=unclassified Caballeronia TaxID=2646786 RepID=UPI00202942CC|nr:MULTISPECIES: DNA topoisomerase IB [unclassified Caballeronia]MDR5776011.1 DNA topoisomerase IB [Caballeronia sp. LZ002]MDR5829112.1 DNA topoisomerase IB [Caballeronia sp. LP006]MDR5851451.1 DNA topoisomerase IB [Caballeronia sp. LZ003]